MDTVLGIIFWIGIFLCLFEIRFGGFVLVSAIFLIELSKGMKLSLEELRDTISNRKGKKEQTER